MDMGLGTIESFAATWVVMMAADDAALGDPVVLEFARTARTAKWMAGRHWSACGHVPRVWLIFGVVCYAVYTAMKMPWPNQAMVVGLALALAGVYSVSPIKTGEPGPVPRALRAAWPLPFNLMRSGACRKARATA